MPTPRNRQRSQEEAREGASEESCLCWAPTSGDYWTLSVDGLCLSSFGHPGTVFLFRPPGNCRALEKPKEVLRSTPRQLQKQNMDW